MIGQDLTQVPAFARYLGANMAHPVPRRGLSRLGFMVAATLVELIALGFAAFGVLVAAGLATDFIKFTF